MKKIADPNVAIEELTNLKSNTWKKAEPLHGVKGLTPAEIDMTIRYINSFQKYGKQLQKLPEPKGKIKEMLDRYGIVFEKQKLL